MTETKGLVNVVFMYIYGSSCFLFDHFVCSREHSSEDFHGTRIAVPVGRQCHGSAQCYLQGHQAAAPMALLLAPQYLQGSIWPVD